MARHLLKQGEVIKLSQWLIDKAEHLRGLNGVSKEAVAQMATKDLNFKVTETNLIGVIENMPELKIDLHRPRPNKLQSRLESRLDKLRQAVAELYNKVGESVPEDIGIGW